MDLARCTNQQILQFKKVFSQESVKSLENVSYQKAFAREQAISMLVLYDVTSYSG
jgi:hypothetical protein